MKIAGKHVKNLSDTGALTPPSDGDMMIFDSASDTWIPIAAGDIPVSVAGVTAVTLNAALLEIFDAIP